MDGWIFLPAILVIAVAGLIVAAGRSASARRSVARDSGVYINAAYAGPAHQRAFSRDNDSGEDLGGGGGGDGGGGGGD